MSIDYQVGVAIPFTSDAKEVLGGIVQAAKGVRTEIASLQKQVADLDTALVGISGTAKAAAADITGLGAAMRASGMAADSSATAANNTARAYDNVARSASAAAMRVAQLNAAVLATGGFAGASAATSAVAFVPPAIRARAAAAIPNAAQAMLPAVAGPRLVGAQNAAGESLALREEGWASSYFAGSAGGGFNGGRGGGGGGGNGGWRTFGNAGRGWGGAPVGPPPPGGGGGGGGGGGWSWGSGFPNIPIGGVPGMIGKKVLHFGVQAAKYGAMAAAGYATDAVYEAAKFQSVMTSIQNVTGANDSQMANVRQRMFDVGHLTAESPVETARMFREIARQSQGQMSLKDQLGLLVPAAKLATVMSATRGMSPEKTIDTVMSMTHLFRQYDPKGVPGMMDTLLRMGELTPDTPATVARQMAIMEPTLKSLHVPDQDAAAIMVALSRFGMAKGRGGSSVQDLFQNALGPLQLTRHAQAGKLGLLQRLGVVDSKGDSKFFTDKGGDLFGFLEQLHKFSNDHGSIEALKVFKGAFGIQGTRFAAAMNDQVIIKALHDIRAAIENQSSLGLDKQFKSIRSTADKAFSAAWNDFQGLATELGTYALPGLTKGFNDVADGLHNAQVWLHKHKEVQKEVGDYVTGVVNNTEAFVKTHWQNGDFQTLGADALTAAKDFNELAGALATASGNAMTFYHRVHDIVNPAFVMAAGAKKGSKTGASTTDLGRGTPDFSEMDSTGHWKPRSATRPFKQIPGLPRQPLGGDPTRPLGTWPSLNLPAPQVGPTRNAQAQVFHIAPNVKVDIHGMNEQQAKDAVRKGVREGVADAMKTARQQSAMVALSKSGATVTGPTIPASLSIFGK